MEGKRKKSRATEESRALRERTLANAERTRKLAEKAQAELDRRTQRREPA
jgi:hypothetical protein